MGLFGGQRIDGFSIFLMVTLVLYTIIAGGVSSAFAGSTFTNPYGGSDLSLELAQNFTYYDVQNLSKPALGYNQVEFSPLNPNRRAYWVNSIFGEDYFNFKANGIGFWESLTYYQLEPSEISETEVLANYDFDKNYSKYILNVGGQKLETYVYIHPQFYDNGTHVTFLYDSLEESIDDGEVTIFIGVNATFPDFGARDLMGVIIGFTPASGTPNAISILISGVWWIMFLLLLVKLVIG